MSVLRVEGISTKTVTYFEAVNKHFPILLLTIYIAIMLFKSCTYSLYLLNCIVNYIAHHTILFEIMLLFLNFSYTQVMVTGIRKTVMPKITLICYFRLSNVKKFTFVNLYHLCTFY